MGTAFGIENIPNLAVGSTTTVTLAATNQGKSTKINVGGQAYTPTTTLTVSISSTGAGGLDTGTVAANATYYVYAIVNQSSLAVALVASTSSGGPIMPSGYGTAYKALGIFSTASSLVTFASGLSLTVPGNLQAPGFATAAGQWMLGGNAPQKTQSSATLSVRGTSAGSPGDGNGVEWGHNNQAGYGSTLGWNSGGGTPYIAFSGEAGTNSNTFRTRGFRAAIFGGGTGGGFFWQTVASANADNQSSSNLATLDLSGNMILIGTLLPEQGLIGNFTEKAFYSIAQTVNNNSLNWTFQDTAGTTNNAMWQGLVSIQMFGDTTQAGQYLYWIACFGNTQITATALGSVLGTGAGGQALTITRPSSNVINFSTNNNGAIKTIKLIFETRN